MSATDTTVESPEAVDAWITEAKTYYESKIEEIKSDPQFLEWAADNVSPDKETSQGWIPGWSFEDCARKWFEHNMSDGFPRFPAEVDWDQEIRLGGFREFSITLSRGLRSVSGTAIKLELVRGFCLPFDGDRTESISEALAQPYMIVVMECEEVHSAAAARAFAAALLDLSDELAEVTG